MRIRARRGARLALAILSALAFVIGISSIGRAAVPEPTPIVVGTKVAPPFAFKLPNGEWAGITIDLWREIASNLGLEYRIQEYDLAGLLAAVRRGEVDVAASSLAMTAKRSSQMEFSYTFYGSGLSMAVRADEPGGMLSMLGRVLARPFIETLAVLFILLLGTGALVWVFERRRNSAQFGGGVGRGIGSGFWWSAVTMTTVGYGDSAPVTIPGRVVAIAWMFTSVVLISAFTGMIASALTVGQLQPLIQGPQELPYVRVGTLDSSSAADYLVHDGIGFVAYATTEDGLRAVQDRKIDAFVNDHPVLAYEVKKQFASSVLVLSETFDPGYYVLAFPPGSPLRKRADQALLEVIESPAWVGILHKYVQR